MKKTNNKKQKVQTVSNKILKQMRLSARVEVLESAIKQMQNSMRGLLEHLEASRQLNAHYLVSINSLAKILIDKGVCTNNDLNETRTKVIADTDFEKKKHEWVDKAVFYESTTDKWWYWDLSCTHENGPFLDEESAFKASARYITELENERKDADPPELTILDRLHKLECIESGEVEHEQLGEPEEVSAG